MSGSLAEYSSLEGVVGACAQDPDRWIAGADDEAKALCRSCPRRWLCARDACKTPRAEGMWAGVFIPEAGRGRDYAFRQLRSLAECGGYPVHKQTRRVVAADHEKIA
jgi:WhiB family transcriptional regulator, redox-sensing transcriptional regulator